MAPQNSSPRPDPTDPAHGAGGEDHRIARAAGRATRAFLDSSRRDAEERAERKREMEQAAEAERVAEARRAEAERQAALEAARSGPASGPTKAARWWWLGLTALFGVLAVMFTLSGLQVQSGGGMLGGWLSGGETEQPEALRSSTGQFVLAGFMTVITVVSAVGLIQLLRRRRNAVGLLTGMGLIVAVPLLIRPSAVMIVLAVLLLIGVALVWLPGARRQLR